MTISKAAHAIIPVSSFLLLIACTIAPEQRSSAQSESARKRNAAPADNHFPESFDAGNKHAYASADVPLATGLWRLDGTVISGTDNDAVNGKGALRIQKGGNATMLFDVRGEIKGVSFSYATYGTDKSGAVSLWYATDGVHWQQAGKAVKPSSNHLSAARFALHVTGTVRFSIHNKGAGRVNVDDFNIITSDGSPIKGTDSPSENSNTATRDDNMALGNPSNAGVTKPANYLLVRPQYTLSYNNDKGIAAWVSWHLSTAWRGTAGRCNCFAPDSALPARFFHALTSQYIATGFDRGHLCPSDDRTSTAEDNAATFLLSNIAPQAPFLNQQPWEKLEAYSRALTEHGQELYIIAGTYGKGGTGSKGPANTIAGGRIYVPAHFWKIIVMLPVGGDDLRRISKDTRVIAVDMPNVQSANEYNWAYYRTTVASIEAATGYHFFSNLPADVAAALKKKMDGKASE